MKLSKQTSSVTSSTLSVSSKKSSMHESSLKEMSLEGRRGSEMRKEMGIKHVRICTPQEQHVDCLVRRKKTNIQRRTVQVFKPAGPASVIQWRRIPGPKLGASGKILSYSVLGEVEHFVKEAKLRGEFKKMTESERRGHVKFHSGKKHKKSSLFPWKQNLNDEKALSHWNVEMFCRKMEQDRLAGVLNRPIRDLLMTRSDDLRQRNEMRLLIQGQDEKYHPDVCFWKMPRRYGNKQIMSTLTKSERGHVQTPVMSGEGRITLKQKELSIVTGPKSWFQSEYLKKQTEQMQGVIHIDNKILFDELEVHGIGIEPAGGVYQRPCDHTVSNSQRASPESAGAGTTGSSLYGLCNEENNSTTDCTDLQQRYKRKSGPSLHIDGTTLSWIGKEKMGGNDKVVKEVFILIQAEVGEMVKTYMTFQNNGSVVLRYYWKKEPVFHPLPVRRPIRRPFYCFDDAGCITPGETVHVPVLFRSQIPGYFTESWLLDTVPVLEGGAKIKFTLKGVARNVTDYTKQCQEIEKYIIAKQIATLCHLEVNYILDTAILKASINYKRCMDEPIYPTREEQFEERNPGFYFHESIIKELWILFDIVSKDVDMKYTGESDVLCISTLRKMICNSPCPVSFELEEHFQRQNELFNMFCDKIMCLTYRPSVPWQPHGQQKYKIMYALVQHGMEEFVTRTNKVTRCFGLVMEEVSEVTPEVKSTKRKSASKGKAKSTMSSRGKIKDAKDPSPTLENTPIVETTGIQEDFLETPLFSPVTKYRQTRGSNMKNLPIYEEKTYIIMYEILYNTLDTFYGLFER